MQVRLIRCSVQDHHSDISVQNGLKNKAGKPVKLLCSQPVEEGLELPFILVSLNPKQRGNLGFPIHGKELF